MENLYKNNITLIHQINDTVEHIRKQNYIRAVDGIFQIIDGLKTNVETIFLNSDILIQCGVPLDEAYVADMLTQVVNAQQAEDYVLFADLLKLMVIPFLLSQQEGIRNGGFDSLNQDFFEKNMTMLKVHNKVLYDQMLNYEVSKNQWEYKDCVYRIEPTNVGLPTMWVGTEEGGRYFHSNYDPFSEASLLAREYYDADKEYYVIYGFGLGYHVKALYTMNPDMHLDVLENDLGIIWQAFHAMDMTWLIENKNIRLIFDMDFSRFARVMQEPEKMVFLIHNPSLKHIANQQVKERMERFLTHEGSMRNYKEAFLKNSRENFKHYDASVDSLKKEFAGRDVIIVGAGPSLDKNVEFLKDKSENTVILATGTVLRKLLQLGIHIDYCIITDPKAVTYRQVEGLEDCRVPLLLLSTAFRKIAMQYKGKKYLICQNGYEPAEEYARAMGFDTYDTGGSVATTAFDVAIRLKAGRIAFIGLDLAFPKNRAHADGTYEEHIWGTNQMEEIPAYNGGTVPSSRAFIMYKEWIEKRKQRSDVVMEVYNATEGGALIQGLKNITLEEFFHGQKQEVEKR